MISVDIAILVSPRRPAVLALATLILAGCVTPSLVRGPAAKDPRPFAAEWKSPRERDHLLTGRILSLRDARWIDEAALDGAVAGADVVLLGETHDNADHHFLQARLVRAAAAGGRTPALAFEMLDSSQQTAIDTARAQTGVTADRIAEAVAWQKSGWPDFAMYRPIFEAGLSAGLPIVAANLPKDIIREAVHKGPTALPKDTRSWLDRAGTPSETELRSLRAEMQIAHCGALPESMLEPMMLAQRARDAQMGLTLLSAGAASRGAILITGRGHARNDRGVPSYLRREAPGLRIVTVGLIEAETGVTRVEDYAAQYGTTLPPFDYVIFTPASTREDPCIGLRHRMKNRPAGATSPAP